MDLRSAIFGLRWKSIVPSPGRRPSRACCLLTLAFLLCSGCETPPQTMTPSPQQTTDAGPPVVGATPASPVLAAAVPTGFGPAKVSILPLSEIVGPAGAGQDSRMNIYVALLDAFGCPIKAPCTLRFELYEYVRRSAQPKGQRVMIWPDIDLMRPADNHKSWRDFLRAYEFNLDLRVDRDKTYVLETTYLGPDGKRLSGDCAIHAGR